MIAYADPRYLLSIDPGLASGFSLWEYSDTEAAKMTKGWQTAPSGYKGFSNWFEEHTYEYIEGAEVLIPNVNDRPNANIYPGISGLPEIGSHREDWRDVVTVICEKWIPYPTPGHSPTLDSTYPLVLEGVLIDRGIMPAEYPHERWRRSSAQYWGPTHENGKKLKVAERRKRQLAWLKESTDLYRTPTQMGVKRKDCQDYHSSVFHALSWFRHIDHRPTIEKYWGNDEPR